MKDRSVECGVATYVQCEFRHPATKTQDPREVHDHDRDITAKDTTNPFSEGRKTQLYYGRGKTGVPGEKTAARTQMMQMMHHFVLVFVRFVALSNTNNLGLANSRFSVLIQTKRKKRHGDI